MAKQLDLASARQRGDHPSLLATDTLVNLIAAWLVRNASTERRIPRYIHRALAVLIERIGTEAVYGRLKIRVAQLVLTMFPQAEHGWDRHKW